MPRDTGHNDTDVSSDDDDLEDRCAICLNRLDDRTLLDKCFHSFCFTCICTWAKVWLGEEDPSNVLFPLH